VKSRPLGVVLAVAALCALASCGSAAGSAGGPLKVVATTSFLRDIAQNVAGSRFTVGQLIPNGVDPHEFDPTPAEVTAAVRSDLLIVNGANLEGTLATTLRNAGGHHATVVASAGLTPRVPKPGEAAPEHAGEPDPHFWLDPMLVIRYTENIRDAFVKADPSHAATYQANAAAYVAKLRRLDAWTRAQVATLPPAARLLVMDHLSHGYFADRYGFRIVGAVIPSVSTGDTVGAQQLAQLVKTIETTGVKAIFVELGENPDLARQIAAEAHVKVVTDLLDHSLTATDGPAPTYLAMTRYDVNLIVGALK
jgi:zinc/manganese transport system substrate-binding protein